MLIKFEIDQDYFGGDNITLLEAVDEAIRTMALAVEQISPILSQYLREFRCECTYPGYSQTKIKFSLPLSLPGATCGAHFEYLGIPSGESKIFTQPSSADIVTAFINHDEDDRPIQDFWSSRLGRAFLWGIEAAKNHHDSDAVRRRELEKVAGI